MRRGPQSGDEIGVFSNIYKDRRVLVTGHTGFKGSWLALWLDQLGADVLGYALAPPTEPNHISLLGLDIDSIRGDVRDLEQLKQTVAAFAPEIVFHLAAQSLVRPSYSDPVGTLTTNVIGTVNVLEAVRFCPSVRAVVNVTSDKCYENREWVWGYRECEPMGGHDPYSASKGCSELLTSAYRRSFFTDESAALIASCRSGNVIGGGDWALDRLVPDLMRAAARGEITKIRNPNATRPWQHVLEPLSGYLVVGGKLLRGDRAVAEAWNFGPAEEASLSVGDIAAKLAARWDAVEFTASPEVDAPHEAGLLKLDCSKARQRLDWSPVWTAEQALTRTADWYRAFYEQKPLRTRDDLNAYVDAAREEGLEWAGERGVPV